MLKARQQIYDQDARQVSDTQTGVELGQIAETPDGRVFQYAQAGSVALAPALLNSSPAAVANHLNRTGVVTVAGERVVTFTLAATDAAVDLYQGGYLAVNVGPGQNVYAVGGNTQASVGNSYSVTVQLNDPISVATTTSSRFSLYPHPQKGTLLAANASAPALQITGVSNVAVPASNYYWSQVGGYASVLSQGVITKNAGAIQSSTVAGAASIELAATVTKTIGYAPEATVDTESRPLVLTIVE